jgi:hypothetical protein
MKKESEDIQGSFPLKQCLRGLHAFQGVTEKNNYTLIKTTQMDNKTKI